tara:strand:- start:735 stop:866 length:132 start_codon:yes stop_codon:yes gene_type:complete
MKSNKNTILLTYFITEEENIFKKQGFLKSNKNRVFIDINLNYI